MRFKNIPPFRVGDRVVSNHSSYVYKVLNVYQRVCACGFCEPEWRIDGKKDNGEVRVKMFSSSFRKLN